MERSAQETEDADDKERGKPPYLVSRNVTVDGRRTSIRLEPYMWDALSHIQEREAVSVHRLCTWIDARKPSHGSLTAAIRVFLLAYYRLAATEKGHEDAGHGAGTPLRHTPFDLPGLVEAMQDTGNPRGPRGRPPAPPTELRGNEPAKPVIPVKEKA